MGYDLKYRTFSQLLDDVRVDFRNYTMSGLIEPQQLIKVARRVNKDLGLRVQRTKETVLEIEKTRTRLPEDFYQLNFALIVGTREGTIIPPQGTHVEEVTADYKCAPPAYDPCAVPVVECTKCQESACDCPKVVDCVQLNSCGNAFQLVQYVKTQRYVYTELYPLKIRMSSEIGYIMEDCPNLYWNTPNEAYMKDGFLTTTFESGKIYMNYQGNMEDEEGNVLVLDHEEINEYYEYALKERILENLLFEGEDVVRRLEYIQMKLRASRNNALSIVNTPDFSEIKKTFEVNRKAFRSRYVDMFRSYPPLNYTR
jgi:hypothetical protein